jgi:hypothetical protein
MRLKFPREVLLVEIERRCGDAACNARVFVGLTKDEARAYTGFVCERCERWTDDALAERDIPDWWEELKVTALDGVRPARPAGEGEPGEVVARMSEAWRRVGERRGAEEDAAEPGGGGEEAF